MFKSIGDLDLEKFDHKPNCSLQVLNGLLEVLVYVKWNCEI